MATGEIVKPREIVKANNALFRCKYKIKDVVAGRIFMAFASLVDHKDVKENQSFVEYRIAADSILPDTCEGGNNYKQLEDAARTLINHTIEQHNNETHFKFYTLFSTIEYDNGIIRGEFHKDLVPFFIVAREKFTKLKLNEYMSLPSIYSQCIFGFLKSWDDRPEITVKLSELHEMLDTPQSFKKDFYEFKRRVLDKAHKDINEKTGLSYEWEPIKNGRSVSEIKFIFVKRPKKQIAASPQATAFLQSVLGEVAPFEQTRQGQYEAFLRKFPNTASNRSKTWKIWFELYDKGKAPLAKDVKDESNPVEFLKQWQSK